MPLIKNPLIRYRVLDACFQRPYRRWSKKELLDALSHALREQSDYSDGVSQRTLDTDISNMRKGIGGEGPAPILCDAEGNYYYEDPHFKYFLSPLTAEDAEVLQQVLLVLQQFQGLGLSERLDTLVRRIEKNLRDNRTADAPTAIEFEQVPAYTGTPKLQVLHRAIRSRQVLQLTYQSFDAAHSWQETVHPYLLKQYNNRWFLIGLASGRAGISNFALDRILATEPNATTTFLPPETNLPARFAEIIGVSFNEAEPVQEIHLRFHNDRGQYVRTKPLHASQQILHHDGQVLDLCLRLRLNRELETQLLAFGEDVEVLAPAVLRTRLQDRLRTALTRY
ncbi:WYL domain-containing protein [Hymenobacter sp. BT186]|uniref:WYL domain-containing protein n=1 Tax=Hymenobacter telluris TaxID=2816474 RepID=A0A939JBF1_9BACT|nr:WYL domain-containing protein [Hymenobacter telluris]MBO0360864.1 WYL domain-containing protein [Hymenobacter telluris]MBW3376893.1 WYL domain-containing protein [Hymenobacter norwichensis]